MSQIVAEPQDEREPAGKRMYLRPGGATKLISRFHYHISFRAKASYTVSVASGDPTIIADDLAAGELNPVVPTPLAASKLGRGLYAVQP